jgi:hypothetical protein
LVVLLKSINVDLIFDERIDLTQGRDIFNKIFNHPIGSVRHELLKHSDKLSKQDIHILYSKAKKPHKFGEALNVCNAAPDKLIPELLKLNSGKKVDFFDYLVLLSSNTAKDILTEAKRAEQLGNFTPTDNFHWNNVGPMIFRQG